MQRTNSRIQANLLAGTVLMMLAHNDIETQQRLMVLFRCRTVLFLNLTVRDVGGKKILSSL